MAFNKHQYPSQPAQYGMPGGQPPYPPYPNRLGQGLSGVPSPGFPQQAPAQPRMATPQQTPQQQPAPQRKTTIPKDDMDWAKGVIRRISEFYESRVVGQTDLRTVLLVSMIAGGHVLLESVPGLAKTTAAKALADAVSGDFSRIQCTPDLLPSDIVGTQIYNAAESKFETVFGPVFANFVLVDEVNRSSAKTQSAMLEAMQERQVTIGDKTYQLPGDMFIVIATQNPVEQEGTYPLSEAQEDRFLCKEILTYPSIEEEMSIMDRVESGIITRKAEAVADTRDVKRLHQIAKQVFVQPSIKRYIANITDATRHPKMSLPPELARYVRMGASPRASISLLQASKALALIYGRDYVVADDVKYLCRPILRHRITLSYSAVADDLNVDTIVDALVNRIQTP